jgi:hypothetical protein
MANINSQEYITKFGSLVQYGVSYMQGFSAFADQFIYQHDLAAAEINEYGYSDTWIAWQKANSNSIIDLYNQLDAQGLIPTSPIS